MQPNDSPRSAWRYYGRIPNREGRGRDISASCAKKASSHAAINTMIRELQIDIT